MAGVGIVENRKECASAILVAVGKKLGSLLRDPAEANILRLVSQMCESQDKVLSI